LRTGWARPRLPRSVWLSVLAALLVLLGLGGAYALWPQPQPRAAGGAATRVRSPTPKPIEAPAPAELALPSPPPAVEPAPSLSATESSDDVQSEDRVPRAAGRGFVNVATPGGWADVFVAGRHRGRTPVQLELLEGRRMLVLRAFGERAIRRNVLVRRGQLTRLVVRIGRERDAPND
jgi:hypothetical protein